MKTSLQQRGTTGGIPYATNGETAPARMNGNLDKVLNGINVSEIAKNAKAKQDTKKKPLQAAKAKLDAAYAEGYQTAILDQLYSQSVLADQEAFDPAAMGAMDPMDPSMMDPSMMGPMV